MDEGLPVFDLTPLTRGAAANRRAVIKGIEFKLPTLIVGGIAVAPGLLVVAILWPFTGSTAIVALPVVVGLALWLFEGRSSKGMQLRNWELLRNRATASTGHFYVSGQRFDPVGTRAGVFQVVALPVDTGASVEVPEVVPAGRVRRVDTGDDWEL